MRRVSPRQQVVMLTTGREGGDGRKRKKVAVRHLCLLDLRAEMSANGKRPPSGTFACATFITPPRMRGGSAAKPPGKSDSVRRPLRATSAPAGDLHGSMHKERNRGVRAEAVVRPGLPLPPSVVRRGEEIKKAPVTVRSR